MRLSALAMIFATVRIVPRPGQEEHTLRAMRAVADSAKALPGCVVGKILREVTPPWGLIYSETWQDERRLEQHLISPSYDLLLQLLEASVEPPTVNFRLVSEIRDLAWVEQLRLRAAKSRLGRSSGERKVIALSDPGGAHKKTLHPRPPRKPPTDE